MKRVITPSLFVTHPRTQNLSRSFLFFSPFPYWIKEKSVVTLDIRNICNRMKNNPVLPLYYTKFMSKTWYWPGHPYTMYTVCWSSYCIIATLLSRRTLSEGLSNWLKFWSIIFWIHVFKSSHPLGWSPHFLQSKAQQGKMSRSSSFFLTKDKEILSWFTSFTWFNPLYLSTKIMAEPWWGGIRFCITFGWSFGVSYMAFESIKCWTLCFKSVQFSVSWPGAPGWKSHLTLAS